MASLGNLEFTMGIKDNASNTLKNIKQMMDSVSGKQRTVTLNIKIDQNAANTFKNFVQGLGQHANDINKITQAFQNQRQVLQQVSSDMKDIADMQNKLNLGQKGNYLALGNWQALASVIYTVRNAFNAFGSAMDSLFGRTVEFEKELSNLAAIRQTSIGGIADLEQQALSLGRATNYTASQVVQLQTELAKIGYSKNEILAATEPVLEFAQAVGTSLDRAATVAGTAVRAFGLTAADTKESVASLAIATTNSNMRFEDMETMIGTVGPVASQFGLTLQDVTALMMKLRDSGMNASTAATSLRNIFLNLSNSESKLSKLTKANVHDFESFIKMLEKMVALQKQVGDTEFLGASGIAAGKRGVTAFNNLVRNADQLRDVRESITDVGDALDDMASTQTGNAASAILRLQSAFEGWLLTIRESDGVLKSVIDWIAKLMNKIEPIAPVLLGIVGGCTALVSGMLAVKGVLGIVRLAAGAFGATIAGVFPWLSALVMLVGAVGGAFVAYKNNIRSSMVDTEAFAEQAEKAATKVDLLAAKVKTLREGSEDYKKAVQELSKETKKYGVVLDEETAKYEDINAAREKAIELIYAESDAEMLAAQRKMAAQKYNENRKDAVDAYAKKIDSGNEFLDSAIANRIATEMENNKKAVNLYIDAMKRYAAAKEGSMEKTLAFGTALKAEDELLANSIALINKSSLSDEQKANAIEGVRNGFKNMAETMKDGFVILEMAESLTGLLGDALNDLSKKSSYAAHQARIAAADIEGLKNQLEFLTNYANTELNINLHFNMDDVKIPKWMENFSQDGATKNAKIYATELARTLRNQKVLGRKDSDSVYDIFNKKATTYGEYAAFLQGRAAEYTAQAEKNVQNFNPGNGSHIDLSSKKDTKSNTDKLLQEMRNKFAQLKKVRDLYKQFRSAGASAAEAIQIVKDSGLAYAESLPEDILMGDIEEKLDEWFDAQTQIIKSGISGTTEARRTFIQELVKQTYDLDAESMKRAYERQKKSNQQMIEKFNNKYGLYESLRETFGVDAAKAIAGIDVTDPGKIIRRLFDYGKGSFSGSFDDVNAMSDEDKAKLSDPIKDLYDNLIKLQEDFHKKQQERWVNAIKNVKNQIDKLNALETKRNETNKAIMDSNLSPNEKKRLVNANNTNIDYQAMQLGDNYQRFMKEPLSLALNAALDVAIDATRKLKAQLESGAITQVEYAEGIAKINEQMDSLRTRETQFQSAMGGNLASYYRKNANAALLSESGKFNGKTNTEWTELADSVDSNNRTLDTINKTAQAVISAMTLLSDTLGAMGMNVDAIQDMLGVLNGGMSGMGTGQQVGNMLQGFGLENAGPWGAAIGAGLGIIGGIMQVHDKRNERKIEALKKEVTKIDNAISVNENWVSSYLGHAVGTDAINTNARRYQEYQSSKNSLAEIQNSGNWFQKLGLDALTKIFNDKYAAEQNYEATGNNYNYQRDLLEEEYQKYQEMYNQEHDKKKNDESKEEEYLNKMDEIQEKIREFSENLAKELYGIDIKGWATQLGDAIEDAWERGIDAAEAFKKTAKDLMKEVIKSWVTEQMVMPVLNKAKEYLFGADGKSGAFGSDNVLDTGELEMIALILAEASNAAEKGASLYDRLDPIVQKALGYSLKDNTNSSIGASITTMSEQTADILSAYVNTIREDVHLIMLSNVDRKAYYDSFGFTMNAQLEQQQQIAANTLRTADAVESLDRRVRAITLGNEKLHIA